MKTFVVVFALLASVFAHSYLTSPPARTGTAGITAGWCGAAAPASVNYTAERVAQAGRKLTVQWCTCQHTGTNAISLAIRPRADTYTEADFTAGRLSDLNGKNTFNVETGTADLEIPESTAPGEYTILWRWNSAYYSCTDVRIDANDGQSWCYTRDDCNYKFSVYGNIGGYCDQTTHTCSCYDGYSGEWCEKSSAFGLATSFALIIAALIF